MIFNKTYLDPENILSRNLNHISDLKVGSSQAKMNDTFAKDFVQT